MAKALIKIREVLRPASRERIGFRIVAAVPNMAGNEFGGAVPSFRKPYLIAESSDYTEMSPSLVSRFIAKLAWSGYTEFSQVGALASQIA